MNIYHLFILIVSIGLIENASIHAEEEDYKIDHREDDTNEIMDEVEMISGDVHKRRERMTGRVFKGGDCEYIKISGITANSGCASGNKFVIKQQTGVRKQFIILDNEPILAFINRGKKFTQCTSYTEVTTSVTCKVRKLREIIVIRTNIYRRLRVLQQLISEAHQRPQPHLLQQQGQQPQQRGQQPQQPEPQQRRQQPEQIQIQHQGQQQQV